MTFDWISAVIGAIVLAASHYVKTGLPPLIDPTNSRPVIDKIRDAIRDELAKRA